MATFLARLGRLAFRRRWAAVFVWVLVLVGVGAGAALAPKAADSGFSMPGTESQKAFDLIQERFPGGNAEGATARIVFVAPSGQKITAAGAEAAIDATVTEAAAGPQVASAVNPFQAHAVSQDGSTAYATVNYTAKAADLTDAAKASLRTALQHGQAAGLTVEVGGDALAKQPAAGGATEGLGILVAALVLLITFGSLAAAGLPLLTAIVSVGVGTAGILALGSVFGLSSSTGTLATMLGLAVGIDYAVFIVSRYREERARGHAPQEAAGLAVGTAGSAVVFAGLTVVIGLAGLTVVGIPGLTKMGLSAAGAVVVAVLVALTLVPALLGMWPRAVLARSERRETRKARKRLRNGGIAKPNGGTRWARFVLRRPLPVLLLAVVGLGVIAAPVTKMHLGTAGDESKSTATSERRAYDDLAKGFGPGFNGPLTVVVDAKNAKDPKAAVAETVQRITATPGVVSVSAPRFDAAGDAAIFSAVPSTAPDDQKTVDLIKTIRAERPALQSTTGSTFALTGSTAVNVDSAAKVQAALIPYLVVVVGLAFVLLMIVFRSLLVPLKAALGFLLSVLAALGAVVTVFQQGHLASLLGVHQAGPIMFLMPIFMVGIVFGLAMDYEVFLVTRVREAHVHGERFDQAIVSGFRHSARVVAAAALIMTAVFSGFIGADDPMIKMIGFGMAIAVLFDAFVVRMAIVPAALALLGERAWWMPRWLDRLLPKVDVEGKALERVPATERDADEADTSHQDDRDVDWQRQPV
ncbi:MMPL family transporter [Catenulispora rubra]|uniref:MMPL family transporter n=1 Tax=Catenulispora rubra TaxID=280293 RepID=UPI0018922D25|nr:MMPL family transporter [Catenulispora rubra]